MVLLVSYDLNGNERPSAYAKLKRVIEGAAVSFRKPLYSQWMVETEDTVETWSNRLTPHIDEDDQLLITQVTRNTGGHLKPLQIWDWLEPRI